MKRAGWLPVLMVWALLLSGARAGLLIDPLRTVLECEPGERMDGEISVTYEGVEPLWIETTFLDQSDEGKNGIGWIKMDTGPERVKLEPGESVSFAYTILLPEGASGEYRGRVRFLEVPESMERKAGIGVLSAISVPIYVNVKGTEQYGAEIRRFEVKSLCPLRVTVYLKNTGNIRLRPEGAVLSVVDEGIEQQVFSTILGREYPPVFPGEVKPVEIREEGFRPEWDGNYTVAFSYRLPGVGEVLRAAKTLEWSGSPEQAAER